MAGIAQMPQRRGEITGADEDAVDAFGARDGLEILKSEASLHLQQDAKFLLAVLMIILDPAEARGARVPGKSAHAARRIKLESLTRRKPIAAKTKHHLNLRDQGRCMHQDSHGNRCEQTRWLDRHHLIPVSRGGGNSVENLVTVCGFHHELQHQ